MVTTAIIPPNPSTEGDHSEIGPRLIGLVRCLDKSSDDDASGNLPSSDDAFSDLVRLLQNLIGLYARHGLLRGDKELAEKLMSSVANDRDGSKKRSKNGANRSDSLFLNTSDPASNSSNLVFTAIIRLLGGQQQNKGERSWKPLVDLDVEDQALLVLLAADLCASISEFIRSRMNNEQSSVVTLVEYEIIASQSKSLLTGFVRSMDLMLTLEHGASSMQSAVAFPMEHMPKTQCLALQACHRAAISVMSLLGNRLSRNQTLMAQLLTIGVWKCAAITDYNVLKSTAMLYATIPLTGAGKSGTNGRVEASATWGKALQEIISMHFFLLNACLPINSGITDRAQKHQNLLRDSETAKDVCELWMQRISIAESATEKKNIFIHCLNTLTCMLKQCLAMEALGSNKLLTAEVDIISILDLTELLLSFSMSAEANYFKTKKRLRHEIYEGGHFNSFAMIEMANSIRVKGCELLEMAVSTFKLPVLLPFSKRLLQTSYTALVSASSTALRNILEERDYSPTDRTRKRWLNSSIALRATVLQTVDHVIAEVGLAPCQPMGRSFGVDKSDEVSENLIKVICGCLIEQLESVQSIHTDCDDWGSHVERYSCLVCALNCLNSCLTSSGPYPSNDSRSLIDSTLLKLLTRSPLLPSDPSHSLNKSVLDLGKNAVLTPWSDGGASSLAPKLRSFALDVAKSSGSHLVVSAAREALRICDAMNTPRAPALTVVNRTQDAGKNDVEALADRIRNASRKPQPVDDEGDAKAIKKQKIEDTGSKHLPSQSSMEATPKGKNHVMAKATDDKLQSKKLTPIEMKGEVITKESSSDTKASQNPLVKQPQIPEASGSDGENDEEDDGDIPDIMLDAPPDAEDE